jgi:hypothetical protein
VLASSYPLLDIFWTMLEFFAFFIWIWLLIIVFADIFRSRDLSGGAKALWVLFVLIIPLIGVLIYLIARGNKMHERAAEQARQQDEAFRSYVQDASKSPNSADQLEKLAELKASGAITDAEYEAGKAKVLG